MKTKNISLILDEVVHNPDGSYEVYWGYHNRRNAILTLNEENFDLYLKSGTAIINPVRFPAVFYPGVHHRFFCTIINEKTLIRWKFFDRIYRIDERFIQENKIHASIV